MGNKWIGIDLDGTLAFYDKWIDKDHIGEPIPLMLERVKTMISEGHTIKIFTARAAKIDRIPPIKEWAKKQGLGDIEVTNEKDDDMIAFYDDKAVQVIKNVGLTLQEVLENALKVRKNDIRKPD